MRLLCYLAAATFGLAFGSFFNVAIYRLPRKTSLGHRSRCPACGRLVRWYDNVPLLSFLLLRGRCRACGRAISWRYPSVELASALLFVLMYWWSVARAPGFIDVSGGQLFQPELLIGLVLASVLIVITGVDITHGIIPNKAVAVGVAAMLPVVVGLSIYRGQPWRIGTSTAAAVTGGAFFLAAGLLYGAVLMRREPEDAENPRGPDAGEQGPDGEDEGEIPTGVGMGDVKLMLVTGLALGYFNWYFVIVHIFISALLGTVAAIPLKIFAGKGRKDRIPFGPFLAAGAIFTLIWGQAAIDLYLKLFR